MARKKQASVKAAPDGLMLGAVAQDDGRCTFALYAPGKQQVALVGDFNDWNDSADLLHVTEDGVWWIEKQLDRGTYAYKFVVDGTEIVDPYARRLSPDATPQIAVGNDSYEWGDAGWDRPPFHDLIIYELHVGDFSAPYTFASVTEKLPYLRDLGVNAIELLPVMGFGGKPGWGYDPRYFLAPEQDYGTPEDLKALIDQAHQHGIAVILDVVFAHTAPDHPFAQLYGIEDSPWYGDNDMSEPNQFGFPKLDHTRPATKAFVRDVQNHWITEYHIDGFRYDYTLGIGYNMVDGVSYLVHSARETMPNLYLIAEQSPEKPEMVSENDLNGAWHIRFSYAARALLREGTYHDWNWENGDQWIGVLDAYAQGYESASQMVSFVESHDEERIAYDVMAAGKDEESARHKSALGAILLLTAPGVPMLYHGQEWGEATGKTTDHNPLHWEMLDNDAGLGLKTHYQRMIGLRRDHGALRTSNIAIDHCSSESKTLVYHRWNNEGDEVVVALNFSPAQQQVDVPFPSGGRWRDIISGDELDADGAVGLGLGPSQGRAFVKV